MRWQRSALTGGLLGFALAMPLFECFLLTALAVDGELLGAHHLTRIFSRPLNALGALALWHVLATATGAGVGAWLSHRAARRRRHLRVLPGGAPGRRPPFRVLPGASRRRRLPRRP